MLESLKHRATLIVSLVTSVALVVVAALALQEASRDAAWVAARQMYGLTAFGFLMAASLIGPAAAVLAKLPAKSLLVTARRAIGVSSVALAVVHALAYLGPALARSWRELFKPGLLWSVGLALGLLALCALAALAWTSRDTEVRRLGGRRWKRLHRIVYVAVPVVFVHAALLGGDFGLNRPPDTPEADFGSLIGFGLVVALWVSLLVLRKRRVRWPGE
jgi:DMSO/TMAO reductase YedYZ heme-binding membrane subunit